MKQDFAGQAYWAEVAAKAIERASKASGNLVTSNGVFGFGAGGGSVTGFAGSRPSSAPAAEADGSDTGVTSYGNDNSAPINLGGTVANREKAISRKTRSGSISSAAYDVSFPVNVHADLNRPSRMSDWQTLRQRSSSWDYLQAMPSKWQQLQRTRDAGQTDSLYRQPNVTDAGGRVTVADRDRRNKVPWSRCRAPV